MSNLFHDVKNIIYRVEPCMLMSIVCYSKEVRNLGIYFHRCLSMFHFCEQAMSLLLLSGEDIISPTISQILFFSFFFKDFFM